MGDRGCWVSARGLALADMGPLVEATSALASALASTLRWQRVAFFFVFVACHCSRGSPFQAFVYPAKCPWQLTWPFSGKHLQPEDASTCAEGWCAPTPSLVAKPRSTTILKMSDLLLSQDPGWVDVGLLPYETAKPKEQTLLPLKGRLGPSNRR